MRERYTTLKDVARLAGTTAATVSYVLNEKQGRYISQEMRERVLKAVEETGYVKNSAASGLRGKKRGIIAVLVPQFSNRFFTRIVLAIEAEAEKQGYILSICDTFDDPKRELDIINRMAQHRVDGYILIPTAKGMANTAQLRQLDIPYVVVDRPLEGVEHYNYVTTNNYQCGQTATEHLIRKGHRKMAFVNWNSNIPDLERRRIAFQETAAEAGIPEDKLVVVGGDFSAEAGYELTRQIIENHRDVTAIFYGFNVQARGGVNCLVEHGMIPGRDISVILIGSPEWASVGQNHFVHVDQHELEQGELAAKLLLGDINETKKRAQRQEIQLRGTLCEGTSVADIHLIHT